VLLTTALAIAGSFTTRFSVLACSLVTSVAALVGYAELIGYTASNNCQGTDCITQTDRFRNNIRGNSQLGLPAGILPLHHGNNPSAHWTRIPSNPNPQSL
jgi:hypothetical protein